MTREEAIKVLSSYDVNGVWADVDGKPYNAEEQAEAFDMAIEALSADTVSREQYDHVCEEYNRLVHKAVCIKLCNENCEYEKGKTCYHAREHSAIEALQAKPAKHGKWINKQKPNINYIPPYNCSECGGAGYGTDYCPNCGAQMDKE